MNKVIRRALIPTFGTIYLAYVMLGMGWQPDGNRLGTKSPFFDPKTINAQAPTRTQEEQVFDATWPQLALLIPQSIRDYYKIDDITFHFVNSSHLKQIGGQAKTDNICGFSYEHTVWIVTDCYRQWDGLDENNHPNPGEYSADNLNGTSSNFTIWRGRLLTSALHELDHIWWYDHGDPMYGSEWTVRNDTMYSTSFLPGQIGKDAFQQAKNDFDMEAWRLEYCARWNNMPDICGNNLVMVQIK